MWTVRVSSQSTAHAPAGGDRPLRTGGAKWRQATATATAAAAAPSPPDAGPSQQPPVVVDLPQTAYSTLVTASKEQQDELKASLCGSLDHDRFSRSRSRPCYCLKDWRLRWATSPVCQTAYLSGPAVQRWTRGFGRRFKRPFSICIAQMRRRLPLLSVHEVRGRLQALRLGTGLGTAKLLLRLGLGLDAAKLLDRLQTQQRRPGRTTRLLAPTPAPRRPARGPGSATCRRWHHQP